jgi:hypothetical protein
MVSGGLTHSTQERRKYRSHAERGNELYVNTHSIFRARAFRARDFRH